MIHELVCWIEKHGGLWSFLQGLGTFVALLGIVITLRAQQKSTNRKRLEDFISSRNLAYYLCRIIQRALTEENKEETDLIVLRKCIDRVDETRLGDIHPSYISEALVDMSILGEYTIAVRMEELTRCPDKIKGEAKYALARIDKELPRNEVKFRDELAVIR